jgi:hypothetical protein
MRCRLCQYMSTNAIEPQSSKSMSLASMTIENPIPKSIRNNETILLSIVIRYRIVKSNMK